MFFQPEGMLIKSVKSITLDPAKKGVGEFIIIVTVVNTVKV